MINTVFLLVDPDYNNVYPEDQQQQDEFCISLYNSKINPVLGVFLRLPLLFLIQVKQFSCVFEKKMALFNKRLHSQFSSITLALKEPADIFGIMRNTCRALFKACKGFQTDYQHMDITNHPFHYKGASFFSHIQMTTD